MTTPTHRRAICKAIATAPIALASPVLMRSSFADEVTSIVIVSQHGLPYLPLMVMDSLSLVQKHATRLGIATLKPEYKSLGGTQSLIDALLSRQMDFGVTGVPSLATLWDKTAGTANEVRALSAVQSMPFMLVTNRPAIKTIRDFTAVGLIATSPNTFVVHPSLPVKSVRELIALARQRPGELSFASAGVGSTTHLAGEYFRSMAGIKTVHVPYKGSGQAEIDLATGQVHYMIDSTPAALPNIKAGRTRALATTGTKRFSMLPDVPTVAESGLPQYESVSWWGILAPAGLPPALVERLNGEMNRIMNMPEVKKLVLAQGAEAWTSTPQEFANYMQRETALYTRIVKDAGIKVE